MKFSDFLRERGKKHAYASTDPVGHWCWMALARSTPAVIDQAMEEFQVANDESFDFEGKKDQRER